MKPSDAQARLEALDPGTSLIVQAPAGSGKTGLLIQRYLALLARVVSPEEILAITFTRKAAAEMKDRVLAALKNACPGGPPEGMDAHEARTFQLACRARQRDAEKNWNIMDNPARLRIGTIDAFCGFLTRRMPVLSGFGMHPALTDDPEPLYREAAAETVMELESQKDWSDSMEALVFHLDNDIGRVERMVAGMLSRRDQWLRHVVDSADIRLQRETLENALGKVIENTLERAYRHMPPAVEGRLPPLARFAAENLFSAAPASPICACLELDAIPARIPAELETWTGIAELLLTRNGGVRKGVDKRIGFPPAPDRPEDAGHDRPYFAKMKSEMKALLSETADSGEFVPALDAVRYLPAPYYTDGQWHLVEALFEILRLAVAYLQIVFEKQGVVDFTEVSLRAQSALGDPERPTDLALLLDYGIRHILVDEFQDTSISQFELFLKLTAGWTPGDGKTFFAVGDPMQSIYSFREAEVGLFLKAAQGGLGPHLPLKRLTLAANFRSGKKIVDWVNTAFSRVFPEKNDPVTGAVAYSPSEAVHPSGSSPAVRVHPVFGADEEAVAQRVMDCVSEARRENPGDRIAVLVRSRSHLKKILPAFRKAGIGYRAVEIDPLGQRPVVSDLTALSRALSHPADRVAWLAILRAPWCAIGLEDLFVIAGDDHDSAVYDLMRDPERLSRLSGEGRRRVGRVLPVFEKAMAMRTRESLRRRVEKTWTALGGPACQTAADIYDAAVFLDFLEKRTGSGTLTDYRAFEDALMGLFSPLPPDAGDEGLQVMTIHKAKGLQFDTVILPGLEKVPMAGRENLLLWQELSEEGFFPAGLLLAPVAETGGGEEPTYRYIKTLHRRKSDHESMRLLYVAATRARRRLDWIGCVKETEDGATGRPDPRSLLYFLWPAVESDFVPTCHPGPGEREKTGGHSGGGHMPDPGGEGRLPQIRSLPGSWRLPELPADIPAAGPYPAVSADVSSEDAPRFDWAGMPVRVAGTVIHKWLRILCETGADRWDANRIGASSAKIGADLRMAGLNRENIDEMVDMVVAALLRTLSDATGRWLLSPHKDGKCEYPLTGIIDGRVVSAVIDRTFVDEAGIRWIVDYKSGVHGGGDTSAFMERERLRYESQTARYAALAAAKDPGRRIRRALYFPVFSGWCPWPGEWSA